MKYIAILIATAIAAHALTVTSSLTLTAPFNNTDREGVTVTGRLTLQGPPTNLTFSALNWTLTGGLTLNTAGNYVINGPTTLTGSIIGPASGTATIQFTGSRILTGSIASNVRVLQPGEQPPPTTPPAEPPPVTGANASAPLVNISTRVALSVGQIMNPGFVVGGTVQRRVLIRAIGPSLSQFNVTAPMAAPQLAVFSGQTSIGSNSGWGGTAALSAAFTATGAFGLPTNSRDAAILLTLSPGNYTAQVRGDTAGEVLLEIYFVD